jgi:predicted ATP-grasp superfamily ATP-dependent carboligase
VLITGGGHPGGLAALRALDAAGFETSVAVQSRRCRSALSRAAAKVVQVPDPRAAPEAFARALADAAEAIGAAAVLPGTDAALLALAERQRAFADSTAVGAPPELAVRRALDKTALQSLCERAGFDVPPTRRVAGDRLPSVSELSFPAVVKPLRSELSVKGRLRRFEAARVGSPDELARALAVLPGGVGLVQPYIEGRFITLNGVALDGDLHGLVEAAVHRVWPDRCGSAVSAETVRLTPRRGSAVASLMKDLGWSGVFNLQLIERGGRDYVIDLNPRFYASLALPVAAGLNLPAIWASLLVGLPVAPRRYRVGVRFRDEKGDPRAILTEVRRGEFAVARDLLPRGRTVHAHFSLRDPRPALSVVADGMAALRRRRMGEVEEPAPHASRPTRGEKVRA